MNELRLGMGLSYDHGLRSPEFAADYVGTWAQKHPGFRVIAPTTTAASVAFDPETFVDPFEAPPGAGWKPIKLGRQFQPEDMFSLRQAVWSTVVSPISPQFGSMPVDLALSIGKGELNFLAKGVAAIPKIPSAAAETAGDVLLAFTGNPYDSFWERTIFSGVTGVLTWAAGKGVEALVGTTASAGSKVGTGLGLVSQGYLEVGGETLGEGLAETAGLVDSALAAPQLPRTAIAAYDVSSRGVVFGYDFFRLSWRLGWRRWFSGPAPRPGARLASRAADGDTIPPTGLPEFDQLAIWRPREFLAFLDDLEGQGITYRHVPGADFHGEFSGARTFELNWRRFRYLDLLHERVHYEQIRAKGFPSHDWQLYLGERGAYGFEIRLGLEVGFSTEYLKWAYSRIDDYRPRDFNRSLRLSATFRGKYDQYVEGTGDLFLDAPPWDIELLGPHWPRFGGFGHSGF